MHQEHLLKIKNLSKSFSNSSDLNFVDKKKSKAIDNISFNIVEGESLGLVGESGSGKTTLGKCIIRLIKPDNGTIIYNDLDIVKISKRSFNSYRTKFQMIFQNPDQSLNPIHTIHTSLAEPIKFILKLHGEQLNRKVSDLLNLVGLEETILNCYPSQLSGGQKKRVSVARALSVNPSFIIADEPTTALDAIYKYQILDLILGLRKKFNLTQLLISHDWSVISHATERVAVMYQGKIVELGLTNLMMNSPFHPYTRLLINSANLMIESNSIKKNNIQHNNNGFSGCVYANKCPFSEEKCCKEEPYLLPISNDRKVACHYAKEIHSGKLKRRNNNL